MLHRYWFRLSSTSTPSVLNIGCGITAYDVDDAKSLLREKIFSVFGARDILEVIADVDVNTLDQGHVIPNMSTPSNRGVWFPQL
ncbi:hypothetical protein [Dyella koreensis]|uniref:Uncharacterized protein n=1 Tax=Dyella koreensis TaxID=311235 RepID=A0ABW8K5W4_9GAMM